MKIRTKLFVGFSILLIILFALAGIGINRLTAADKYLKEIYDNRYQKVKLSVAMRNNANEVSRALVNVLMINSEESDKRNFQTITERSALLNEQMVSGDMMFTDIEERRLADEVKQSGKRFMDYKDNVINLYQSGRMDDAIALRTRTGNTAQDQFVSALNKMNEYQDRSMDNAIAQTLADNKRTSTYTGIVTVLGLLLGFAIMYWVGSGMNRGLAVLHSMITAFATGHRDRTVRVVAHSTDEFGRLATIFNKISEDLETTRDKEQELNRTNENNLWLQTHSAQLQYQLQDCRKIEDLGRIFMSELSRVIGAQTGSLYVVEQALLVPKLVLAGSYARYDVEAERELEIGQGLIGQVAADGTPIRLREAPAGYARIGSSFGSMEAVHLIVQPVPYEDKTIAVLELASLRPFTELEERLVTELSDIFGLMLNSLQGRLKNEELLRIHQTLTDELQSQSEELLSQQDELKSSNERLEEQARALKASEELLQRQQEELEQANDALMRKTAELEEQVRTTEEVNREIEHAKEALEKHSLELAMSSRYKSEFLANMSHELRTPLNSLLILSQMLKENKEGNLSGKQVEYAETIYASGCDLLKLIDDVLDLAKVEAGRMDLHVEPIELADVIDTLQRSFGPLARSRNLEFKVRIQGNTPDLMESDRGRLLQILKNLLSNAFKFTHQGRVLLEVGQVQSSARMLAFSVEDTGIGISSEKQHMIFEAFQQADGTTSRKYGGTGLGLSISKQLAELLGGTIELESEEGKGSRFTLLVPITATQVERARARSQASGTPKALTSSVELAGQREAAAATAVLEGAPRAMDDDRGDIGPDDKVLLIIEDDVNFAAILLDMARGRGFKGIVALAGDTGLALARERQPDAILLDIQLPVIDGWSVLVQLKSDAATRHIPVHVISVVDEIHQGLSMGAIAWLRKPASKEHLEQAFAHLQTFLTQDLRSLLIVDADEEQRDSLTRLIAHDDVSITATGSGREAMEALLLNSYDCVVLDYGMLDPTVYEMLDWIKAQTGLRRLPIIIHTGKALEKKEQLRLKKYAESIIIKDVMSPERLLDETSLFLHRVEKRLPEEKQRMLQRMHSIEAVFAGKKVLLVDDDIRNVFALSNLLEGLNMQVAFAETGRQALEQLEREPDFDLVLMDIMMPEMDGYEAMRAIREEERFQRLPIIALTAKAMKEDREKCIKAGASDYITKPIHTDQLLSLMRVWLCK